MAEKYRLFLNACAPFASLVLLLAGCSATDPQKVTLGEGESTLTAASEMQENLALVKAAAGMPPSPEKTEALVGEVGRNWLYGQGLGETALNIGAIVAFPPYAIVVVTNLGLTLSGHDPLSVSKALPDPAANAWSTTYDQVTCAPGQVAAAIAGEEFRNKHRSQDKIVQALKD